MCYSNIVFLQLRSVDLPDPFENAIQESEVKKQDIQKANAEYNKVKIELDTLIQSAQYQKNITINIAEGNAQSILRQNEADVQTLSRIQNSLADGYVIYFSNDIKLFSYKNIKDRINLTNLELLTYIKVKFLINL
ncbi:hypothetical protein GW835_04515 [archaeon]|nr:hypothetical protein [archaeon]